MSEARGISLDEFKARLPLAEIVGRHVRLVRRGREYTGLCPFHAEKTPSFTVSETKGFYHCFGCGQHGNAIDFVMALEGLDFGQALTRLSELTGIPAPQARGAGAAAVDHGLLAANEAAARWFAGRLQSPAGAGAQEYLHRRGLEAATITRFGLGYAPTERTALRRALQAEGYAPEQLVAAGLLIQPDDGGEPFDRFRDRVMFPIHDARGRIVGFGGRALGEARAKYLNTPETALFHKGELLYGLHLARAAAREQGTIVVAEGYMDVIALARAGFANAVAPLGTAVSEAQLELLWRLADEPVVCLDADEAGLRAGRRLIERALPLLRPGKSLRFALMPAGADPDDVLRQWGREALARALREAKPLLEFLWESELRQRAVDTPERRAALRQHLLELAQTIADPPLRRMFRDAVFRQMEARFGSARRAGAKGPTGPPVAAGRGVGAARLAAGLAHPAGPVERDLLGPIVVHPQLLAELEEALAALEFGDPELELLRQRIIAWYAESGHLDPSGLNDHLCKIGFAGLVGQLSAGAPATAWYCRADVPVDDVREGWLARLAQHRRLADPRALKEAVAAAIVGRCEREVKAHVLAVNRLINPTDQAGGQSASDESPSLLPDR